MRDQRTPAGWAAGDLELGWLAVEYRGEWYAATDRVRPTTAGAADPEATVAAVLERVLGPEPDGPQGPPPPRRRVGRVRLGPQGGLSPRRSAEPAARRDGATLVALQDVSASTAAFRTITATLWRWVAAALEWRCGPLEKVLVVHRRQPERVTAREFFQSPSSGGTKFVPAYTLVGELLARAPSDRPAYVVHVTDGHGWSPRDEEQAAALAARWMHGVARFTVVQTGAEGMAPLLRHLRAGAHPAFRWVRLGGVADLAEAVRIVAGS